MQLGITMTNLQTVLRESDVISIHVPGSEDNIGLIGSDMFGKVFGRITQGILLLVFLGGTVGVDVMLNYVDALNMIMILVHVIGMLFLTKRLRELTTGYFSK